MLLTTLTHTPNPMKILGQMLSRPSNKAAVMLLPVGYPATDAKVPSITCKTIEEIVQWDLG